MIVEIIAQRHPGAVCHFEQRTQPIGSGLVRAEHAEIVTVLLHYIAQKAPHYPSRFSNTAAG